VEKSTVYHVRLFQSVTRLPVLLKLRCGVYIAYKYVVWYVTMG